MSESRWTLVRWAALVVAAVALPYVVVEPASRLLVATALIYALLAGSWNLTLGFAGVFNFAHVGFFGVGGYVMAIAAVRYDVASVPAVLLATGSAAVAAALTYLPVIRMRGIYVALITFVFVQLCYYLVLALPDLTGGSNGLPGLPAVEVAGHDLARHGGLGYLWVLGGAVALLLIALDLIMATSFGQSLVAIRDNEHLAASRGISRVRQHLLAFAVSGAMAGFAGAMYVSYFRVADGALFGFGFISLGLSMIFLGGTRQTWGPVVGAVVVTVLSDRLADLGAWRQVVIGAGTVAILVFAPEGISGAVVAAWRRLRSSLPGVRAAGVPARPVSRERPL